MWSSLLTVPCESAKQTVHQRPTARHFPAAARIPPLLSLHPRRPTGRISGQENLPMAAAPRGLANAHPYQQIRQRIFIVDNSDTDWKVLRYLHDWCQISNGIDIA